MNVCIDSPRTPRRSDLDESVSSSSPTFQRIGTSIPTSVIRKMRTLSDVQVTRECGITTLVFEAQRGPAHDLYDAFVKSLPETSDPIVSVGFPAVLSALPEAASIVQHYAPLRAHDFHGARGGLPRIPPPLPPPHIQPGGTRYNGMMALDAVKTRIANPQDPAYPVITSLPRGTVICHLTVVWAKATLSTHAIVKT